MTLSMISENNKNKDLSLYFCETNGCLGVAISHWLDESLVLNYVHLLIVLNLPYFSCRRL